MHIRYSGWRLSGCSSQCSLDTEVFAKHFLAYLNDNAEPIMMEIADRIMKEAASLKENAEKELKQQLESLQTLEAYQ